MSVQKKGKASKGAADKAVPTERKSKSGGEGKRKKIFAESLGTAHLIELSNAIAESEASKLKERIDKAKDKAKWVKEKRAQSLRPKKADGATSEENRGKKMPLVSLLIDLYLS